MSSYQPPIETVAIFNSQSFPTTSYSGQHDPTKLDYPVAQGVPSMSAVNVTNGTNTNLITPTGVVLTNSTGNALFGSKNSYNISTYNTSLGVGALNNTTSTTTSNTVIGYNAGNNTNGSYNTYLGYNAGNSNTSGYSNVCIGMSSGGANLTVSGQNTCIGYNATMGSTSHTTSTVIGYNAVSTASNQIVMGTATESVVIPSRKIIGLVTAVSGAVSPAFPLSEIYNITPSLSGTAIVITLPSVATANIGAKTTFRITDVGNANVSLSSSIANIFPATTSAGITSHIIYTGGTSVAFSPVTASISTTTLSLSSAVTLTVGTLITGGSTLAGTVVTTVVNSTTYTVNKSQTATPTNYILPSTLNTHTFMLLSTSLCVGGLGWFQLGTV